MSSEMGITREELLALLKAHGYEVTDHQLTRWRQEGLLPRPQQRSLGKGRGTQTVYPPGTGEQLLALCEIHANERRLDYVAWHLWWAGYEVSLVPVRRFIASVIAEWDKQAQQLIDPETGELSDSGWKLAEEAAEQRLPKPLSGMRKRVGKKWFETFTRVALEALLGRFEGFSVEPNRKDRKDDERHVVEKGLRLRQGREGSVRATELWPKVDIESCLKDIGWLAGRRSLARELTYLTDEQLIVARDETRSWLALLAGYGLMFEKWLGRGSFGIVSVLGQMVRDMGAQEQALFTHVWAIGRFRGPEDLREGLETHGKPTQEMYEGLQSWEQLGQLQKEVPALSEVLTPQRIRAGLRAAFQGPQELERFEKELEKVSREVATDQENHE